MHKYSRPKSSIPRRTMDPVRFRGRHEQTHIQAHEPTTRHPAMQGRMFSTLRRMFFNFAPYEKED